MKGKIFFLKDVLLLISSRARTVDNVFDLTDAFKEMAVLSRWKKYLKFK